MTGENSKSSMGAAGSSPGIAAASTDNGSNFLGGAQFDLGLQVQGPVSLRRISNVSTNPTLIYAEIPSP